MVVRKAAVAAILGVVFLLLLSSAVPTRASHGDMSGLYGGTFRVAVRGALNLNPFTATDADSWKVIPLVYDSLARLDPVSLVPRPWAAQPRSIADPAVSGAGSTVPLSSATGGGLLFGYGLPLPIVKSGPATNPVGGGPWELT